MEEEQEELGKCSAAGWECQTEQQVRGRRSSTADVEGLAQEGFRRGRCEGTRAPPLQLLPG